MLIEYIEPSIEIIRFVALEEMATAHQEKEARDGGDTMGGTVTLPSIPEFTEDVEEWD